MGKLSYNDKLHMQMLCEQGLGEKAIISSYPDRGWKLSTVKKVCSRVDRIDSAILHKPGSRRPATASACAVCRCKTIFPLSVKRFNQSENIQKSFGGLQNCTMRPMPA